MNGVSKRTGHGRSKGKRRSLKLPVDVYSEERINLGSSTMGLKLEDPAKEV
jgi:hypothetical protein